jgi:predicted DNA-binding ArsR family transcriptional regulator
MFSTNKTDRHDSTEILSKVALNIITPIHSAANNMFHAYIGREQVQECIKKNIQKLLKNGTTTFVIRHMNGTQRITCCLVNKH